MSPTDYGWLVLLFPLLGTVLLMLGWPRWPGRSAGWVGSAAIGLAFASAVGMLLSLNDQPEEGKSLVGTAYQYVGTSGFEVDLSILVEILRGGAEQVRRADAVLVGGHTVRDQEIKYGLSVTGVVAPEQLITNREAKPGDQLLLTKPLGTGYITTAAKAGQCSAEVLQVAVDGMCRLNRIASQAAVAAGIRAMTDVTGFGLAGHALELAEASGVTIALEVEHIPSFPSAIKLGRKGYQTRANKSNRAFVDPHMRIDGDPDPDCLELCFDAQTSGGLLIATPPDLVDPVVRFIVDHGEPAPVRVGEVIPREVAQLVLR